MGNFASDLKEFLAKGGNPNRYANMTAHIGGHVSCVTARIHYTDGKKRAEFSQQSMQLPSGGEIQMGDDMRQLMDNIAYTTSILSSNPQQQ